MKWGCALAGLMVGAMPATAWAQDQAVPAAPAPGPQDQPPADSGDPEAAGDEIVVSGQVEGAVPGDVKPEQQLGPAEIRSYGASNITELMTELSSQLGSGSGRGDEQPVVLLSGRRSSMREIGTLPPEAIQRIDILPEEAALQYGYSATQKVINFVLRRRYASLTAEVEGRTPTAGGNAGANGEADVTVIRRDERITFGVEYDQSTGILESERGVSRAGASQFDLIGNVAGVGGAEIDPALSAAAGGPVTVAGIPDAVAAGGVPTLADFVAGANQANVTDITPYRTLVGPQKRLQINGSYARPLSDKVRATLSVQLDGSENYSLQGLPSATLLVRPDNPYSPFANDVRVLRYFDALGPLTSASSARNAEGGLNLNGEGTPWASSWNWSFEGTYRVETRHSTTERGIDASPMQSLLDVGDPAFNPFTPLTLDLLRRRPEDQANSRTGTGRVNMLTTGPLFSLPAGKVRATLRVAGTTIDKTSNSLRNGIATHGDISRDSGSVRGSIDLPITSRRYDVLSAIGDLSLNTNFEVEQFSDFGRLTSSSYGLRWSPIPWIQTRLRWDVDGRAPNPGQLADPVVTTPNVRIFDYVRNESVDITRITGGNPLLRADDRHVFSAALNIRPTIGSKSTLDIQAEYTNQRYRNASGEFPGPTAEVEAAFPDRFVRDASGRLLSVDYRAINFDRQDHEQVKWGFNLWLPIGSPAAQRMRERMTAFRTARQEAQRTGQPLPPEVAAQMEQFRRLGQQSTLFGDNQRGPARGQGPQGQGQGQQSQNQGQEGRPAQPPEAGGEQGARRFGPGGGGGGFGRGGGGGGRGGFGGGGNNGIRLGLSHTWVLKDLDVIRPGLPVLDYLDGSGRGRSGGTSAHQIELRSSVQRDGYRLQLNGNWQSATQVATGALGSTDRLRFHSLAKFNLAAQVDLSQQLDLVAKHPWFRGSRVSLRVDNVFDAHQRVTDINGETPTAYAPNLMDPLGRLVRLSFRKQFY
ncbi:MAG: TonB-dependent receptor [Sphingomonas sp.]|uniref:TonB-dependent receptor n=1 Tax=Sphingomonas sp. TaxID=28214 RepID=UPI001B27F394|nr:TonB-dependent receptor [Sphingomonas sp.]MBO9622002.1 TonB-dependent receptor [Sphingomonas sp.]